MKKICCFLFMIILASCSTTPPVADRTPAAGDSSCAKLIADFTSPQVQKSVDLELIAHPIIASELKLHPEDQESMAVSFSIIKKEYPHFSARQVVDHYNLLLKSCAY